MIPYHLPKHCDGGSACANTPVVHFSILSQTMGLCEDHQHLAPKGRVIHRISPEMARYYTN